MTDTELLYHKYSALAGVREEGSRLHVGDRADCGFVVTREMMERDVRLPLWPRYCTTCWPEHNAPAPMSDELTYIVHVVAHDVPHGFDRRTADGVAESIGNVVADLLADGGMYDVEITVEPH